MFQRQHGGSKFSLSGDRRYLLLHNNLYQVLLPPNTEELIFDVSGRTKCVHNRLVHIELVGAQASQAARQAVRHAWTNLGSLGSIDHLSSLGNRGRP